MLKETLDNMKQKIERANEKWSQENDQMTIKNFENYHNPKSS